MGVLSSRVIALGELEMLLYLLGPPSERQRSVFKRVTDIVLVEEAALFTGRVLASSVTSETPPI